jgi:hypothetical protein
MKKLSKLQTLLFRLGGVLVLVGAVLNPVESRIAPYVYCVGAILFAAMQMAESYEGTNVAIRRLRRQQLMGAVLLMLSGVAMFGNAFGVEYMRHNEWLIVMLIAAFLELYTAFRIPAELDKEKRKESKADKAE